MRSTDNLLVEKEIDTLKKKIEDTKYFIANALCKETQLIYEGVLKEHEYALARLLEQKNSMHP